jgi:hypothetical protein
MIARRAGKGAPVILIVYPGATHAFNDPEPPVQLGQYFGHHLAYDPQATAAAWKEVRTFLQTTLAGPQPAGSEPPNRFRRDPTSTKLRLKALEAKVAQDGLLLTAAQIAALKKTTRSPARAPAGA